VRPYTINLGQPTFETLSLTCGPILKYSLFCILFSVFCILCSSPLPCQFLAVIYSAMIAHLKGVLTEKSAGCVVVDVRDVGYEVVIPFSTYYELGEIGDTVSLRIYTHVKEDAFQLYGFLTRNEKRLFTRLIQISGIGPKLGVTILSGMPVGEFVEAVTDGDVLKLNEIPGVGKKTADFSVSTPFKWAIIAE